MRIEDYPTQEPLPDFATAYAENLWERAAKVQGKEIILGDDAYQSALVFQPEKPNGNVLVFFHGGGWTCGYKEWNSFMAPAVTNTGCILVSVGYRLAPKHIFPAGFDDCADGVTWTFENIEEFGGDSRRIFVGGHSAGGHYASLLSLTEEWRINRGLPETVIRGCIPVSGTFRFDDKSGLPVRPRFLGLEELKNEGRASSIRFISNNRVPFLMAWGSEDYPHLITQNVEMSDALMKSGTDIKSHVIEDANHLDAHLSCGDARHPWFKRMIEWVNDYGATSYSND